MIISFIVILRILFTCLEEKNTFSLGIVFGHNLLHETLEFWFSSLGIINYVSFFTLTSCLILIAIEEDRASIIIPIWQVRKLKFNNVKWISLISQPDRDRDKELNPKLAAKYLLSHFSHLTWVQHSKLHSLLALEYEKLLLTLVFLLKAHLYEEGVLGPKN